MKWSEPLCKPGLVSPIRYLLGGGGHSSRTRVAASLQRATRERGGPPHVLPYLLLLRVGLAVPSVSLRTRCALTAPFHPCRRSTAGGLFSVALSRESPRLAVSQHPALWSPDFPLALVEGASVRPNGSDRRRTYRISSSMARLDISSDPK